MTNVPTDRTEELKDQETVEQLTEQTATTDEETVVSQENQPQAEVEQPQEAEPTAEEIPAAETEGETETDDELPIFETDEESHHEIVIPETLDGIVERLRNLAEHAEQSEKAELDLLKQNFYKILKEQKTQAYADFIKNGGNAEEFELKPEPLEDVFKEQMTIVKERRAKIQEAIEQQKEINVKKKLAIIDQIKTLATSPEEANKNYEAFRKLQEEWKAIKPISASSANEVWKKFQFAVEQYYDLLKENNALRDYDFKKNLAAKTLLCEAAEKLVDDPDIINASHQLQQLHQEFREIGPVAKDLREELWERFKKASTTINKRHAQYFEQLKGKEEENLEKKTALCEEIENIETANLQSFAEWDNITKRIIEIQQNWKEIGRAPKKMNTKIFERFRAACDNFFNKKADHFKEQKKVFAENAAKKTALCEEAEALKDSTDWNSTTNKLVQLQKDWKNIGPAARKVSNSLWERFNAACNYFFEQKKKVLGDQRKEETTNLTKKKTIIDKLEAIAVEGGQDVAEKVRALMDEWTATGHVPFKDKDKVYSKYHDIIDRLFKEMNLSSIRRGGRAHKPERNKPEQNQRGGGLYRQYEAKKAELATYENNISFLTSHSKSGNALIDNMNKKIEALKAELAVIVKNIKAQEAQAEEPAPAETPETPAPEAAADVTPAEPTAEE